MVGSAYTSGVETLKRAGIVSAAAEMRTILSEITGLSPLEVPLSHRELARGEQTRLEAILDRLLTGLSHREDELP